MRQTTRIAGKRVTITTNAKTGKTTVKPAKPLEEHLQAAIVRRLKSLPEYGPRFILAGDMNAARRSPKAQATATATGIAAGDPDMRIYLQTGRLRLIELKVGKSPLTASQRDRHPALWALGHDVTVLRADSEGDAADQAEKLVLRWVSEVSAN